MGCLIPIQYHKTKYPEDIKPRIEEIAGNFDISSIKTNSDYSLHTEYSFTNRRLDSTTVSKYQEICKANKKGIPMLWYSQVWAIEFAEFIKELTKGNKPPKIIEIHPPFSDYSNIEELMNNYKVFKNKIDSYFLETIVLIENRSGTRYSGGTFTVSTIDQIVELSMVIDNRNSDLRITLDIPQLFTTHQISKAKKDLMIELFNNIKGIRHNILGIHLWGKKEGTNRRRVAHIGDLNSYFMYDKDFKNCFLECMFNTFDDDLDRYFVPEVNSGSEDLASIVSDLKDTGFIFI